jgi:hypothetical protein
VFAYTNDGSDYLERLKQTARLQHDSIGNLWRDVEGMTVENFGNTELDDQLHAYRARPFCYPSGGEIGGSIS